MRQLFVLLAVACLATPALAGKTSASSSYKASGKSGHYYGRDDGIYQSTTSKSPYILENGTSAGPLAKGFYESFAGYGDAKGLHCEDQAGYGACAGNAALAPCICESGSGVKFVWMPLDQQDIAPDMDATSLDVGSDQTDNDASMLLWGLPGASGRPFVVGDDPAFYMCTTMAVEDASGIDQTIAAGFLGIDADEAFNADFEALNEYVGIGPFGTAASGFAYAPIHIKTEDDGAGVTSTNTTVTAADATAVKYCTYVSNAGVVTYTINGAAPTVTAAFTLDDGAVVIPFITFMHTNDVAGEIDITNVEVGYQD